MNRRHLILGLGGAAALEAADKKRSATRLAGITMMPEYIQTEGIDSTLKNLTGRARATAVTISPYVMEPASEQDGSREPPIDAGAGKVRLLDRPLWGKRELFVRTAPSFEHDLRLFKNLRYQPSAATELTRKQGPLIADFIKEAKRRGLRVYFQVQAAIPPGYRVQFGGPQDEDRPRLPDGSLQKRRLANNGSLASPEIRKYVNALIRDTLRVYPEIDGIRLDWPEYPPYLLDDVFLDFSTHAETFARKHRFPFDLIRQRAQAVYRLLHSGSVDLSRAFGELIDDPIFGTLFALKGRMVREFLRECRYELKVAGGRDKELLANSFPTPFSVLSGMHNPEVGAHVDGVAVKLYTMHWPMMLRFWCEQLLGPNPDPAREAGVVGAVANWMQIDSGEKFKTLAACRYPEPLEPHPANDTDMERKLSEARNILGDKVAALAHGYGPAADFRRRLAVAWEGSRGRTWINRYGYLSDEKLEIIGDVCRA